MAYPKNMTPEQHEQVKKKNREYARLKYQSMTPEQKKDFLSKKRKWLADNPDKKRSYYDKHNEWHKKKLETDEHYKKKYIQFQKKYRNDPIVAERIRIYMKNYHDENRRVDINYEHFLKWMEEESVSSI